MRRVIWLFSIGAMMGAFTALLLLTIAGLLDALTGLTSLP